jgi:hypothetical protein
MGYEMVVASASGTSAVVDNPAAESTSSEDIAFDPSWD